MPVRPLKFIHAPWAFPFKRYDGQVLLSKTKVLLRKKDDVEKIKQLYYAMAHDLEWPTNISWGERRFYLHELYHAYQGESYGLWRAGWIWLKDIFTPYPKKRLEVEAETFAREYRKKPLQEARRIIEYVR